jgi:hypothetical protein
LNLYSHIQNRANIKFLGLEIDQHLNKKTHIEQIIPRLSSACYAVRSVFHFSNLDTDNDLLCILSFNNEIWNHILRQSFRQLKSLSVAEENCENYDRG